MDESFPIFHNEEQNPLMIPIPKSQQHIDVRTLIRFLQQASETSLKDAAGAIASEIDSRIKCLNLYYTFDVEETIGSRDMIPQNLMATLYELRGLFNSFTFIDMPGKGGKS